MIRRHILIIAIIALCAIVSSAQADGILIPMRQPVGNIFSIKYHHVDVFIDGQAATTKVDQIFHNDTHVEEEGTYVFPLPRGAAINKFSMFIGEKEAEGKILDKDEARRLYESIVRRRKDPALLEYMDRNTFRARVYPIPANGDKRIRLNYTEVVGKAGTLCRYVYPLSTERFSSKPLDDCRVTIRLKAKTSISNIYSPSHVVKVEQSDPNEATVTWTAKNVKPDTDLVLYYSLAPKDVALDVMSFKDDKGRGYFMLLASPQVKENGRIMPKTVVFVLDRTGSMAGNKIDQAKNALKYCLNSLKPEDRFNVVTFNETPDPLWTGCKPASVKANIKQALDAVDRIDASGGTNLHDAVLSGLKQLQTDEAAKSPDFVVLLTDGLPTVGEMNIENILKDAKEANKTKARIFTFGVGYDVNTHLLDLMTEQNGGIPEYVLPEEDIEAKVSGFFASVGQPVLTDLEITASGVHISQMYPVSPPDLFKGSQLIILGRYDGSGKATFTLSGKSRGDERKWFATADMKGDDKDKDFIPQIWAARKIGYLLDQVRLHKSDELIKEIVQLSKEWGIPTEFTSFFVDEDVPIPLPMAYERAGVAMRKAREEQAGSWSVSQSMNNNMLKGQAQVQALASAAPMGPPPPGGQSAGGYAGARLGNVRGYFNAEGRAVAVDRVQNIGTRTFYQRGNQWVDQQTEGQTLKTVQIKQFSNAHFKLLAAYPDLSKFQRLGNMRLYINNQAVEIGDEGKEDLTDAEIKAIVGNVKADAGNTVTVVASASGTRPSPWGRVAAIGCLALLPVSAALLRRRI